jgi:ribonuclease HI
LAIAGWFDGATQSNGQQSGAGGLIRINENTVCTNGLSTVVQAPILEQNYLESGPLSHWQSRLHIVDMQVFGDSRIIIDWLNDKGKLQVNALECWKDRIRELNKSFSSINYTHIYRESNMEADNTFQEITSDARRKNYI